MRILKLTFILLTITGCWRPDSWSSLHKRVAYFVYASIIVFIISTGMLSVLIGLLTVDNADDFCESLLILMDMVITCFKVFTLLINHKNIIMIIDILMKKPCKPSTSTEINIFYKFDKSIEINSWRYASLPAAASLSYLISTLFMNLFRNRTLIFRGWMPYDYSSTLLFYLTYTYQIIAMCGGAAVSVGCDTLICGLLVHICCQIEILTYRLRSFLSYSNVLRDCVRHHYDIFRLAFIVNEKFRLTIAIQFTLTTLMTCFCLYQMSVATTTERHIDMMSYVAYILVQNFLYCWYGNELKIKSHQMIDKIFETEWLTLDENKKKSLMIMMRRTVAPIQITCARIVPVNLETFTGILKMSYSAYNLLSQNMQE